MTLSLAKVNKSSGAHFRSLSLKFPNFLMCLNIQIDLLIIKTYDGQFTLTTKKSFRIIFKVLSSASNQNLTSCSISLLVVTTPTVDGHFR